MEFPADAGNSIDQKQEIPLCRRPVFQTCNELVQTNQPDLVLHDYKKSNRSIKPSQNNRFNGLSTEGGCSHLIETYYILG
jgi:hypothetical protein